MMRTFLLCLLACCAITLGGCTLLVNDTVDPLVPDPTPNMVFELTGFDPHIGQITELRLINDAGNVQAVAIYDGLPSPNVTVVLDNVIRPDLLRVDFYSDLNDNRIIDPPVPDPEDPSMEIFPDHMWREMLNPDGTGGFMHSTNFTDIVNDDPATFSLRPFTLSVTGADPFLDQPAQLWITDPADRDVGYYFLGSITSDTVDITIPGIIDDGSEYIVTFQPGDGGDLFCVVDRGGATGLTITGRLGEALTPCAQE